MLNGLPIYNLIIDELCEEDGVSMMSIVDKPAVEKDFITFKSHTSQIKTKSTLGKKNFKYSLNEDKKIITGVALRADYPIYRKDGKKEYYINMSADVIEKIVHKFMRDMHIKNVNVQHAFGAQGIYLFESFILNQNHKILYPEFKDISNGSWIVSYKVDNPHIWQQIKAGKLKGFSVELTGELIESEKFSTQAKQIYNILKLIKTYEFTTKSKTKTRQNTKN